MAWEQSNRAQRLPNNWNTLRQITQTRANGQCEAHLHDGPRCPATGTDCDHIQAGDNHDLTNLQWLCKWHHKRKTAQEAKQAKQTHQQANQPHKPKHPGLT